MPAREASILGPPASQLLVSELDGEITVYDPERRQVHSLNSTASDVWRLLDGKHSLADIVRLLSRSYDVHPADIEEHVADAVGMLVERGLLSHHRRPTVS